MNREVLKALQSEEYVSGYTHSFYKYPARFYPGFVKAVIEKREHIGGNCFSLVDKKTGVEYHKYGTHIFHTDSQRLFGNSSAFLTGKNTSEEFVQLTNLVYPI